MINRDQFMMGRDAEYPTTPRMEAAAVVLLQRVNALMDELGVTDAKVNSGYRPGRYNVEAHGATNSSHLTCEAVDIGDVGDLLDALISDELLEKFDLYAEAYSATPGWVHLTTRAPRSGNRRFIP